MILRRYGRSVQSVEPNFDSKALTEIGFRRNQALTIPGDDEYLLVMSEQGVDYPKTRSEQKNVIVEGENRLYFYVGVDPPLRIGRYRRRS